MNQACKFLDQYQQKATIVLKQKKTPQTSTPSTNPNRCWHPDLSKQRGQLRVRGRREGVRRGRWGLAPLQAEETDVQNDVPFGSERGFLGVKRRSQDTRVW